MELIDKEALMARIQSEGKHQASQNANRYDPVVLAYGDCYAMAKTAPAVDAVEVVRCKDCDFCRAGSECHYHRDNGYPLSVLPDNYCYWGERRESEGT